MILFRHGTLCGDLLLLWRMRQIVNWKLHGRAICPNSGWMVFLGCVLGEGMPEDSFLTADWNIETGKHKLSLMQLSLRFFRCPKSNSLSFLWAGYNFVDASCFDVLPPVTISSSLCFSLVSNAGGTLKCFVFWVPGIWLVYTVHLHALLRTNTVILESVGEERRGEGGPFVL